MKKKVMKIAAVIGIITMTVGFAGCKKKTECEWCGKMAKCETVYLSMLGEYSMCEECKGYVMPMSENLKGMDSQQQ